MWFGNKGRKADDLGGRGRASKPDPRGRDRQAGSVKGLPRIAWIPLAAVATLVLLAFLVWKIGAWLFWENPAYTVRTMAIGVEGQVITAADVRKYTGLREGINLFSVNLSQARTAFLRGMPLAKSIVIRRKLPDTMVVDVVERVPLARLGRWSPLGVDRDGYVFPLRSGTREFAVITGCAEQNLRPGIRVDQAVMNAIETLDACNRTKAGEQVRIASLDVGSKEFLELYLTAGERVHLAWPDMGQAVTPETRRMIEQKMGRLAAILRASEERGRRVVNLDLTYGDQYVPAQEY